MYTQDYDSKGFPYRDFLLKLILVIVFALILVWFLPKFIQPKIVQQNCAEGKKANVEECSNIGLNALTSQIFQDNLDRMKDAAISYYTNDRLPQEAGGKAKMTLGDMISKKLLTDLYDKNNKKVNQDESYVEITKMDNEYLLKVSITDSEKEDYILVHLGCYNYCKSLLCEKQDDYSNVQVKASKSNSYVPITPSSYVVNTSNTPNTVIKRYYNTKPVTNNYYNNTTIIVNCKECEKNYIWEYKKTTGSKVGEWTNWSAWEKADCNTAQIKCSDNNPSCTKEVQTYSRKEEIGKYEKTFAKERQEKRQVATQKELACSKYNYLIVDHEHYKLTTTIDYTKISQVTTTRSAAIKVVGGWTYVGRKVYTSAPKDTLTRHYKFVGADYSACKDICTTDPKFIYDEYSYTRNDLTYTKVLTETTLDASHNVVATASCGSIVTKEIPVYRTITVTDKSTISKPLYGTVCYKSSKTRDVIKPGKTKYKWSYKNDKNLLKAGWVMTGRKKAI